MKQETTSSTAQQQQENSRRSINVENCIQMETGRGERRNCLTLCDDLLRLRFKLYINILLNVHFWKCSTRPHTDNLFINVP
jgi:hypothetical protein